MSEADDTLSGNEGQDTLQGASAAEQEVQRKLTESTTKVAEAQLYARMMQDPDFAALMQARAAGKKVKIIPEGTEQPKSLADQLVPEEKEVDFENMSNKDLVTHLMRKNIETVEQVINSKLKPVLEGVEGLQAKGVKDARDKSLAEVEVLRQEYADFDQNLGRIVELNKENPGLKPFQLYALAKAEKGEQMVKSRSLSSERPSTVGTRPPQRTTRKTPLPPGMLGMRQAIREAASHLSSSGVLDSGLGDEETEE